ncbi:MAG: 2-dehydro-3-deoxyphosphogluconate aldolase, partial [Clostridia bacterium]
MEYKYLDVLERVKIVPVIKLDNIADTIPLLQALKDGGIPIAEITYRTFAAAEAIKIGAETFPDMVIGAGSVIKVSQASQAVKLGAKFIVSPGFSGEVAEFCVQNGID